jgi:hypothetical protein
LREMRERSGEHTADAVFCTESSDICEGNLFFEFREGFMIIGVAAHGRHSK